MTPAGSRAAVPDLKALRAGPWSTFVYGKSRVPLLRVAFGLARINDPAPYWVDIRDDTEVGDPRNPVGLGWIPEDHLYIVRESEARPQDADANMALWTVVRSDEPESVISGFTDFLRLPPVVQEAVSRTGDDDHRPVFVIANVDRVRQYYPRDAVGVRPILDAMVRAGVLPIFAAIGPPGAGRLAFDFVFEVRSPDPSNWRKGLLFCEKAPPGISLAPGGSIALDAVPEIAHALAAG
jgi:hypothetical protein